MANKSRGYNRYLIFIFLFYFFLLRDFLEQIIPYAGFIDEAICMCAVPIFLISLKKNKFHLICSKRWGYGRYILILIFIGLFSSLIYQYQSFLRIVLPDMLVFLKFWFAIYIGKNIGNKTELNLYSQKIYKHVKIIVIVYTILLCLDWSLKLFPADIRYGMRSTQLLYTHPSVFASCCMFLIIILISIRNNVNGCRKWLIILLFLMCSTLRSKAWGGALSAILIYYFVFVRKKRFRIRTLLLFLPLVVLIGWNQIEYYFFSDIKSSSARAQLLEKAFRVANDHFPIGAGFGTYGSFYSGVEYSVLYSKYGLDNVWGISGNNKSFISDSYWPMLLGQFGYIGCLLFGLAIFCLLRNIQKLMSLNRAYYASALCGLCYLLILSMAESTFVNPVAIPIALYIGILLGQNKSKNIIDVYKGD